MHAENVITVQKVLERPNFAKARVVAGERGLGRRIRWAHVLEISDFQALINGGEMILTTGIGLQLNTSSKIHYLKKLIEYNAACLCIEIGEYFDHIPEEMIEIANQREFPLIVFQDTVRFVDITQDIHSLIINQHYEMLDDLEQISRQLNQLTLTSQGISSIIKLLHESSKETVFYFPKTGSPRFYPPLRDKQKMSLTSLFEQHLSQMDESQSHDGFLQWGNQDCNLLVQPIRAMGQIWAYVALVMKGREAGEFEYLVLDRAAVALAQDLLRKRYMEERELHAESLWVRDLIQNRFKSEEEIRGNLGLGQKDDYDYRVCLIEPANMPSMDPEELESIKLHTSMLARSLFEQHGFRIVMTTNSRQLVIVALDVRAKKFDKERFQKALLKLQQTNAKEDKAAYFVAVGRTYRKFMDAHLSYQEAKFVLNSKAFKDKQPSFFYEDLGVFRLLLPIAKEDYLHQYVQDYLGALIDYDRNRGGKLLYTLKIYLEQNESKKDAAEKLFIVRQTLYHRLGKIRQLLGFDFSNPENRLSLEIAFRAYQLLYPDSLTYVKDE